MPEGLPWILLTLTSDLIPPTGAICRGPRKSILLAHPGRKDASGSLIWNMENTSLNTDLFGLANSYRARMRCFWQLHRRVFVSRQVGESVCAPLIHISARPIVVTYSLPKPPMWCFRGPLGTHRTCILPTLTELKSNLVFTAIYDEDDDNLPSFFPTANWLGNSWWQGGRAVSSQIQVFILLILWRQPSKKREKGCKKVFTVHTVPDSLLGFTYIMAHGHHL